MSERIKVRNFLAIDLGAKSGRAIIGSLEDNKLKISEIHRFANKPIYLLGTIFWDVLNIFSEIKRALTKYAKENGKNLSGIGINSWGVDFGLLGEDGKLLGNPVHYRDERTNGMMEEAFKRVTKKQIFEETGVQLVQINTLYHLLAMKLNNSPILEIARNLLMMADLFNYFLTGEKIAEFTLATTSQAYNPRTSNWSRLLFDER
ncbi:hypothetical protein KA005_57225 [bacterium]|nr:hypothetical protein [bacterium]